jgi:hypothetical protein
MKMHLFEEIGTLPSGKFSPKWKCDYDKSNDRFIELHPPIRLQTDYQMCVRVSIYIKEQYGFWIKLSIEMYAEGKNDEGKFHGKIS